jgi:hypothetical protein
MHYFNLKKYIFIIQMIFNNILDENIFLRCDMCNYETMHSGDFNKHLMTNKHKKNSQKLKIGREKTLQMYECICGKKYKFSSGLSRHKNDCQAFNEENNANKTIIRQILEIQTSQNQYIIDRMDKQDEIIQRTIDRQIVTNIGIQNNIQNNHFCLNIFLNETCKNAMDLDDFIDSIEVGIEDIERMERLDYASGISKLIVDKLNQSTVTGRPLHCTDSKRDIIYIKIKANWEKADTNLRERFIHAIKRIAHKNMQAINLWIQHNPKWNDPRSKTNDKYLRIVSNSMSGATEEEQNCNMDKIVKNIIREVKIDKNVNYITTNEFI